uniref:Carboxypeptidase n=1 Tax=Mesocestoides corti TaxID=53468 RepID=A0A5K3FT99_MESCO
MREVAILLLCLMSALASGRGRPKADRVYYLPGFLRPFDFEIYSGYLEGQTENIQLHYVFVEAETNSSAAPLVLWLNGGPGCSSLLGMLTENGPFLSRPGNRLVRNRFSWNQHANMLYLEAPAGVGFSFARDGVVKTDDDKVADNNFAALVHFFEKFPEFKNRDFYIVGESYGGVYVPTLAQRVVKHPEMELKGIAVDNGLTSYVLNDNSLIYFAYYHSLIDASLWQDLMKYCCGGKSADRCLFTLNPDSKCQDAVRQASDIILYGLNMYNLYAPCDGGVPPSGTITSKQHSQQTLSQDVVPWRRIFRYNRHSRHRHHRRRMHPMRINPNKRQSSNFTREHADRGNLFRLPTFDDTVKLSNKLDIVCNNDSAVEDYLNQAEVRETLHIPKIVHEWAACDADVYSNYTRVYHDLSPQYMELLQKNVRTHIFNGDVDMACNSIGDEWFVNDLGLNVTHPRHAWFYNSMDGTRQIGGYTKTFTHPAKQTNLTFSTVRGAGHMVPKDKPVPGFALFLNFLNNIDH